MASGVEGLVDEIRALGVSADLDRNAPPRGSLPLSHPPMPPSPQGRVLRSTGAWYTVAPDGAALDTVQARLRGRMRQEAERHTNPVAVGDRVRLGYEDDGTATIEEVLPRRNALSRRAAGRRAGIEQTIAANLDAAWVVQSVAMPRINPGLVDRFLVTCARDEVPAGIVLTKLDLLADTDSGASAVETEWFVDLYTGLGYPVVPLSAIDDEGVDDLLDLLVGQTSLFTGASGVGKTSLLLALAPDLDLRTGEVSERTRKGKHTTTFATMHPLPHAGTFVVDTPGIREFGVTSLEPHDLGHYFPEFEPLLPDCRFAPCTHDHEPGCAVKGALDTGEVALSRYQSYLSILEGLRDESADVGR
jgi:ribosome biogenesis GTPase